jgi:membrane associated rhomboid family serine protease
MRWLDALERRFGQWSIPHFPLFIALANFAIYFLNQFDHRFIYQLNLNPDAIRHGQWWRIVTFLFIPPRVSPIVLVIWLYLLYQYAQALENEWGEFRFCFFYLIGAAATVIAALWIAHASISNMPLNTTLFLAFAALYPEFELLLFFIIPVKVKYLAWFVWLGLLFSFVTGNFVFRVAIGASLFNYFLFFGPTLWQAAALRVEVWKNRRRFR